MVIYVPFFISNSVYIVFFPLTGELIQSFLNIISIFKEQQQHKNVQSDLSLCDFYYLHFLIYFTKFSQ